ncbi:hypothetical protein WJX73_000908 [Symbiochloris irregularis]|uniref:60S ribosomal protein L34 n=1 Tax=Symbiochloris irregularis TaxID=706552 RepID=A0AAW1NX04_9CHLO
MAQRLTYRRRHCYATRSNKTRVVKTPGGRNLIQYTTKKASFPKCGVTGVRLHGLKALRPQELRNNRLPKRHKTVNRVYGGHLSHAVVRERIIRAFLIEEQKIVKKVLKLQQQKEKSGK